MTLLVPTAGESLMLQNIVNKAPPQNLVLRLYTNNKRPEMKDAEEDYTEAVGFGYQAVTLAGANWKITPGAPSEASYAQQIFNFTGPLGDVYGYFITQATSGKLMWAERFPDAPYSIFNSGDQIKIAPKLELSRTGK